MLHPIPKPSSLVRSSEPLLGFKVANHLDGGSSHASCLLAWAGTAELTAATFPEINGKSASLELGRRRRGRRDLRDRGRQCRADPGEP